MKKLADYKTKEERIAYLLHVECLASDELWKLPLNEGIELVREISELASRYKDGEMCLTKEEGYFERLAETTYDSIKQNLISASDAHLSRINNENESTGGQMFDLVKDSESQEEYPQFIPGKVVSIGEKYRTDEGLIEVCRYFDGCCSFCVFKDEKPSFCYETNRCRGVYFRKID